MRASYVVPEQWTGKRLCSHTVGNMLSPLVHPKLGDWLSMAKDQTPNTSSNAIETIRADYDRIARDYARQFERELHSKPLDQKLLSQFAHSIRGEGDVCDMGCGPGQVTRWLHELGVPVFGLDLSPQMIQEARSRSPQISFQVGNMLELQLATETLAGIVAFYAIVNLPKDSVKRAFREMSRALKPGGLLLLAFHIGDEVIRPGEWQGNPISMKFFLFQPIEIQRLMNEAGFRIEDTIEREPYPDVEYQSRRAYIFARKPR
jgi:SAM-dependent methyltransferase